MATQAIFQTQWQTYRKVIDHNDMVHREVYGLLHEALVTEASAPCRARQDSMLPEQPR